MTRHFALVAVLTLSPVAVCHAQAAPSTAVGIHIDAHAEGHPFPHFWEQSFGSGRAILSLRESYRDDLRTVKQATGFESVRFHGIFMDDVGLYDPDRQIKNPGQLAEVIAPGQSIYNFSYVDQIYDGLLKNRVRPFVELSFMPKKMASDPNALHAFWYKQNVSPPKDYAMWDAMIVAFAQHLVARYGIDEVSKWNFEVWNEPNIDFWVGRPAQPTYFELYDHTARDLKQVNLRLHVGGPATAQAAWVPDFLAHCKQGNVPVDFVSTHVYANDTANDVFKTDEVIPRDQMVYRSVKNVHAQILQSPYPRMPLIFSEYNASYANEPNVTDTVYMGPWLANTIRLADGLVQSMAYWDFSDVFEEQGVVRTPFYGGFGLMAEDNIRKPAFHAFEMLHRLGESRLASNSDDAIVTRRKDGALVIALWNYAPPTGTGQAYTAAKPTGVLKRFSVEVAGANERAHATIYRLDSDHGNVLKAYDAMGRPDFPTLAQWKLLHANDGAAPPEHTALHQGRLNVTIPPQGLVLLEIK
jgi:xylan 1,4-beta-xylosidase